jgi:hypothetical protein
MSKMTTGHVTGKKVGASQQVKTKGIAAGTVILTLDGALPVDFLSPGDRIITREGMRVLRKVSVHRYSGPAIRVAEGALGHDRPEQALVLPEDTMILIRDWRAEALFGKAQALVPMSRLADGEFIAPTDVLSMRLYDLQFDTPQIVYAEGLELACDAVEATEATRIAAE